MKKLFAIAMMATLAVPLAACGGDGDDKMADRVEEAAENRADALEDQADAVRETGEDRADDVDDSDINAQAMTDQQKLDYLRKQAEPPAK